MSITAMLAAALLLAPAPIGPAGPSDSVSAAQASSFSEGLTTKQSINAVNSCDQVCQTYTSETGVITGHGCHLVDAPYGEGEDCLASVVECSIRKSTLCLGGEGEGFATTRIISAPDGRLLAEVALCDVDQRVIGVEALDFQHSRQRAALQLASVE